MRLHLIRLGSGLIALALTAGAPRVMAAGPLPASTADAMAQVSPAVAEYRRKLAEYEAARAAFEAVAGPYWASITEKRRGRNAKAPWGDIPARPYLGLSAKDERNIMEIVRDYLL